MGMKALLGGNEEGDEDDYYGYDDEEYWVDCLKERKLFQFFAVGCVKMRVII